MSTQGMTDEEIEAMWIREMEPIGTDLWKAYYKDESYFSKSMLKKYASIICGQYYYTLSENIEKIVEKIADNYVDGKWTPARAVSTQEVLTDEQIEDMQVWEMRPIGTDLREARNKDESYFSPSMLRKYATVIVGQHYDTWSENIDIIVKTIKEKYSDGKWLPARDMHASHLGYISLVTPDDGSEWERELYNADCEVGTVYKMYGDVGIGDFKAYFTTPGIWVRYIRELGGCATDDDSDNDSNVETILQLLMELPGRKEWIPPPPPELDHDEAPDEVIATAPSPPADHDEAPDEVISTIVDTEMEEPQTMDEVMAATPSPSAQSAPPSPLATNEPLAPQPLAPQPPNEPLSLSPTTEPPAKKPKRTSYPAQQRIDDEEIWELRPIVGTELQGARNADKSYFSSTRLRKYASIIVGRQGNLDENIKKIVETLADETKYPDGKWIPARDMHASHLRPIKLDTFAIEVNEDTEYFSSGILQRYVRELKEQCATDDESNIATIIQKLTKVRGHKWDPPDAPLKNGPKKRTKK